MRAWGYMNRDIETISPVEMKVSNLPQREKFRTRFYLSGGGKLESLSKALTICCIVI